MLQYKEAGNPTGPLGRRSAMRGRSLAGGRLVAKILVADDNSNIQKMVGLALKDQGIDVVAVGNGEAAVRKISDVRPDLVLADVFMPVRNGYEVCQYVKTDSALAHIPVILLVGAFDPLDEQEAQRVGADGVLKKPFVPPDPLISMVKSALQRAGVLTGTTSAKAEEPEPLRSTDLLTPRAGVPTVGASPAFPAHEETIGHTADQSFVEELPVRPEPVRIDSGAQPVAFGSLLETPAEEKEEEDQSFVSSPTPDFVADRDWHGRDEDETEEGEDEEKPAAWRQDEAESYAGAESHSGGKGWRAGGFEQIAGGKSRTTGWEPEEEKPEVVETAPAASSKPPETEAAPPTVIREAEPVQASPFAASTWVPAAPSVSEQRSSTETATAVEEAAQTASKEATSAKPPTISAPQPAKPEPEKQVSEQPWYSTAPSPWDAEIKKASQLASTWDAPATAHIAAGSSNGTEKTVAPISEETKAAIEEAALPAEAVQAIREEAAQAAEDATQSTESKEIAQTDFYAREETIETPAPPVAAAPSMDDLVAKVLAKMSPDMLQAMTREILKPVVEAMVKEELKSKKP
jgi:CheY-like chemotaxis protein